MSNEAIAAAKEESGDATVQASSEGNSISTTKHPRLKRELSRINKLIPEKENSIKSLNLKAPSKDYFSSERDRLHNDLKATKECFNAELQKKREVDEQIRSTNNSVQTKNEEINKVQSTLTFKNEKKIDSTILKLESQLQKRQVSQVERRDLCSEIEKLKNSREKLVTFRELKAELDELKEKLKSLRATRDDHAVKLSAIRQEEDSIKGSLTRLKLVEDVEWHQYRDALSTKESLKTEIDELHAQRKELFQKIQQVEHSSQKQSRELRRKGKPNLVANVGKSMSLKTLSQTERKIPYEDEIFACKMLISYLEKTFPGHATGGDEHPSMMPESGSEDSQLASTRDRPMSDIYEGMRKRPSRRGKRQRRNQAAPEASKKCVHHPNVLAQFLLVDVPPPAVVGDAAAAIKQLEEKKVFFCDQQNDAKKLARTLLARPRSLDQVAKLGTCSQDSQTSLKGDVTESAASPCARAEESGVESVTRENVSSPALVPNEHYTIVSPEPRNNYVSIEIPDGPVECSGPQVGSDVISSSPPKHSKTKVQFCIGDEVRQGEKDMDGDLLNRNDEKAWSHINAGAAMGRSKSLDSFRGLINDKDCYFTCCRRAASNDRLGLPVDVYSELSVVRSEL